MRIAPRLDDPRPARQAAGRHAASTTRRARAVISLGWFMLVLQRSALHRRLNRLR